jgi:hypothetical protein
MVPRMRAPRVSPWQRTTRPISTVRLKGILCLFYGVTGSARFSILDSSLSTGRHWNVVGYRGRP